MDPDARYAIYFVPDATSALHRFGSAVLGYDCHSGDAVPCPDALDNIADWAGLTAEPRRYGFHATLKAPFRLASPHDEAALLDAAERFARGTHDVPVIAPAIRTLGAFIAIVPAEPVPALDALAARCVTEFDAFRAPPSAQERARRLASGLSARETDNLDRWGYPYVFADFRFHMTLTGRVDRERRDAIAATLTELFARAHGGGPIAIDRLAVVKQATPEAPFRVVRSLPLAR